MEEWGFHHYHGGRPLTLVCNTEHDSPIGVEWADLDDRRTDREVGCYLAHRNGGDEYRAAAMLEDCAACETFSKLGDSSKYRERKDRSVEKFESGLKKDLAKFGRFPI